MLFRNICLEEITLSQGKRESSIKLTEMKYRHNIFSSTSRHNPHNVYDNKIYWVVKHRQVPAWGMNDMGWQIALTHWEENLQRLRVETVNKLASRLLDTVNWLLSFNSLSYLLTVRCCFHTVITFRVWKSGPMCLHGLDQHKREERLLTWPCRQPKAGHLSGGLTLSHHMSSWWY